MEKAYVFLADGFEEIEGLTVVDILRRAGADTQTVSVMGRKEITGSHRITLQADLVFEETSFEDGTLFVLPGGMPGTKHLGAHEGLTSLLKKAAAEGKRVQQSARHRVYLAILACWKENMRSAIRDSRIV